MNSFKNNLTPLEVFQPITPVELKIFNQIGSS